MEPHLPTFDEVFDSLPSGWLSRPEAELLYRWTYRAPGPILEVGCYRGRSSVLLASFNRPLYCVDPFDRGDTKDTGPEIEASWKQRTLSFSNVTHYKQPIEEWTPLPVGFAYLDGDHSYKGTVDQIQVALRCSPSVIAIHDVNDSGGGIDVKRAALEILGSWDERVDRLAVWINP